MLVTIRGDGIRKQDAVRPQEGCQSLYVCVSLHCVVPHFCLLADELSCFPAYMREDGCPVATFSGSLSVNLSFKWEQCDGALCEVSAIGTVNRSCWLGSFPGGVERAEDVQRMVRSTGRQTPKKVPTILFSLWLINRVDVLKSYLCYASMVFHIVLGSIVFIACLLHSILCGYHITCSMPPNLQ